ncbi:MAG: SMP-30/gluconolactonase/LRE family protein, partial [bacterium]
MKKIIISVLVLTGLILFFVVDLLHDAGQFKKIEPHFSGPIKKIPGVVGAEDITIHPESGIALISSDDRRAVLAGKNKQGAIFAFDLQAQNPQPVNLTTDFKQPFHPHGISLYVGENGEARLFVINHRDATRTDIEVFVVVNGALFHRESIADAKILNANDLVAVGIQQFYVTLDHGNTSALGKSLEEYLRLPRSSVLYYDGQDFTKVAAGMKYANGINKSRDGSAIYVAATTDGKIYVYDRNTQSGELTETAQIDLGTGIDNIEV